MTAQIDDSVIWQGSDYSIVSMSYGVQLFSPREYGINPVMIHTGCYRGYYCKYKIIDDYIYLSNLNIKKDKGRYPSINSVKPVLSKYGKIIIEAKYSDVMLPIQATGTIRIGQEFISDLYVHMGYQEATSYQIVKDLNFQQGKLCGVEDLSKEAAKLRDTHSVIKEFLKDNLVSKEWEGRLKRCYAVIDPADIERTFLRNMERLKSNTVIKVFKDLQKAQKAPRWFITNYEDYYRQTHQYYFDAKFLARLGCPDSMLGFLRGLTSAGHSEKHAILAFLETLRTKIVGNLWEDTLSFLIAKQYNKENIEPRLRKTIERKLSRVTLESWI